MQKSRISIERDIRIISGKRTGLYIEKKSFSRRNFTVKYTIAYLTMSENMIEGLKCVQISEPQYEKRLQKFKKEK